MRDLLYRFSTLTGITLLLLTVLVFGCSRPPSKEMAAAHAAFDSAVAEGALFYAPAEAQRIHEALTTAEHEIAAQNARYLRDYKPAKELLEKAKTDTYALKADLSAKKNEARIRASAAGDAARSRFDEARRSGPSAPSHTITLGSLEVSLSDFQKLMEREDYLAAADKAVVIKERADDLIRDMRRPSHRNAAIRSSQGQAGDKAMSPAQRTGRRQARKR
ncbi:MAG: hypothetical protein EPN25_00380 [Nitrospirae bacterium]|nr:MAG: hypothetical protein EPN25_00380 [Nitrospirota bacterium]